MNANGTAKAHEGIEDLIRLIRQELGGAPNLQQKLRTQLERSQPQRSQPQRPIDAPRPAAMWELHNQMQEGTLADIRELVARMRGRLFLLTDSQQQTLEGLDAPGHEHVLQLMGLSMPQDYGIRQLLDTIMKSIPEQPDWSQWWLHTALNPGPGIHQAARGENEADPITEVLTGIIRKIGQRALRDLPDHAGIAWEIAAGNLRPDYGRHYLRMQNERVPLAGVLTVYEMTRDLAARMLVPQEEIPRRDLSPEEVQEELEQEGLDVLKDAGTITTLAALRRDIGMNTLDTITVNAGNRQWCSQKVPNGDRIAPWHLSQSNLEGKVIETTPESPLGILPKIPLEAAQPGSAEWELIKLTVPSHPGLNPRDNWTESRNARIVALLTGTTPEHVIIYMSGHTDHPVGINRPACPMAARCPTHCGIAQTEQTHAFPFTHDGRFDSCRYYRFLAKHQHDEPEKRESFADLNIQLTLRALIKENQRPHVRLAPTPEDAREEHPEQKGPVNRRPSRQSLML